MLKEQGILLLALGHPYYGRMAYNLAMSIKAIDSNVDITLVYTEPAIAHINHRNMWVFDNKMAIESSIEPFAAKLLLNKYSPYERTLYMDVDTLWVNRQSPAKLFEELKGIPFTSITEGHHDYKNPEKSQPNKHYFFWADVDEIEKVWQVGDVIYQWRSEFIYFEKCDKIDELFKDAAEVYAEPDLKTAKQFAGKVPDELAFNIACCMHNIHPHKYKWKPTYWDRMNGDNMPPLEQLLTQYYLISCGSNASGAGLKRTYNRIAAASAFKLKLQHVFPLISKKEMLANRQLM